VTDTIYALLAIAMVWLLRALWPAPGSLSEYST